MTNVAATLQQPFKHHSDSSGRETLEVTFGVDDLLFSRTDERGVIQSVNSIFQSISGYEMSDLIGAPHKLVRHDDMPKAIFYTIWNTLAKGLPIATYVKNRTKNGGYYWVLALISPVEGGYLSVRVKPQTDFFPLMQAEYEKLRAKEKSDGLSSEESAELLYARLKEMGYDSFASFSAAVSAQELKALRKSRGLPPNGTIGQLHQIQEALKDVQDASQLIATSCESVDVLPTNLEIQSSRLGSVAAPIGIIARDCNDRTRALLSQMVEFVDAMQKVSRSVNTTILQVCVAEVQAQISKLFEASEGTHEGMNFENETELLSNRRSATEEEIATRLKEVDLHVKNSSNSAKNISRVVAGLNVTRTMCTIECSLLGTNGETVRNIVDQLETFQTDVPAPLRSITSNFSQMQSELERLLQDRNA